MPDPGGPGPDESLAATQLGDQPSLPGTRLDDEPSAEAIPVRDASSTADSLEATEIDPYATALPTAFGGSLGTTAEDPYSTRLDDGQNSGWSVAGPGGLRGASTAPGGHSPARYHPLRLHAKGGLGEVYLALDSELNREVALKKIQAQHLDKVECQSRFIFEAEITGGLEHPGIVPVYGLGRHADGQPYYAMRFIRGDSLKTAIKRIHADPKAEKHPDHSLEFRQLVTRFVAVCQAIDYAHGRGVLHRDLKPDNIMLGPHGETLVVDWGLAKALDRPDPVGPSDPKPLRPLSGSDTSATMAGSVMGTPSFMSPEQAFGEIETLGPASDIFSLGSTLYALLTGLAPFRGMALDPLIEHVRRADFPRPRSTHPAIPPALEAICLKAMALRPLDRYLTAAALADDLERWLGDEPVSAFPEPWTTRVARWARRHRTAVAAAFVMLATAATALGIGAFLINQERGRTERNYQRARSAVERMLTRVGEVDLADVPQMESVRRDLLDRALGFYRESFEERRGDLGTKVETGRALARLGDIREMLGLYAKAEGNDREAIALLDEPDGDTERRRALARARNNLGVLLKKSNRFVEAEAAFRLALADRRALAKLPGADPDDARAASATLYQLGTLLARLARRSDEDEAAYREAIAEQKALAGSTSGRPEDRREVARYLNNLGILQARSDPDAAEKTFLEAMKLQDALQATSATNAGFRWQRARTWNNLANLYARARLPEEAGPAFAKARSGFEALAADFAAVPDYRRELAMTLNNQAQWLEAAPSGDLRPLDLLRQAEADQARLVEEFPEVPDHRMKLAITRLHLGDLLRATDPAASAAALAGAIALQEKLVAETPQVPEYRAALGRTLTERARSLAVEGKPSESLAALTPAIDSLEKAIEGDARDQTFVRFLFDARADRCRVLLKLARHADLAAEAARFAKIAPGRPEAPLAAAGFFARASEIAGADATLDEASRKQESEADAVAAVAALRDALKRGSPDPSVLDGPDFKPLKGRPDFEKLRSDWQAKGRKAAG